MKVTHAIALIVVAFAQVCLADIDCYYCGTTDLCDLPYKTKVRVES